MTSINIKIKTLSPIQLSSGAADVIVDSDVAHDNCGMPLFSGRRFKGLLRESALEVISMKGMEKYGEAVERLFDRDCSQLCPEALVISDFHLVPLEEYGELCQTLELLQKDYGGIINPNDVLGEFTSIRYQTKLKNGLAEKGSLRNMRVVDDNVEFYGVIEAEQLGEMELELLALAIRNLRMAGMKRNRGFGRISCTMTLTDKRTEQDIINKIFAEGGR